MENQQTTLRLATDNGLGHIGRSRCGDHTGHFADQLCHAPTRAAIELARPEDRLWTGVLLRGGLTDHHHFECNLVIRVFGIGRRKMERDTEHTHDGLTRSRGRCEAKQCRSL